MKKKIHGHVYIVMMAHQEVRNVLHISSPKGQGFGAELHILNFYECILCTEYES
jgi:hypothetical protein